MLSLKDGATKALLRSRKRNRPVVAIPAELVGSDGDGARATRPVGVPEITLGRGVEGYPGG